MAPVELEKQIIRRVHLPILVAGMLLGLGVMIVGAVIGGPLGEFALYGLEVYPFALIAVLAYRGMVGMVSRVFSWILVGLLLVGLAALSDFSITQMFPWDGSHSASMNVLFVIGVVALLIGVVGNLRKGYKLVLPRLLPLDPANSVHNLAFFMVVSFTILLFTPLLSSNVPIFLESARQGQLDAYQTELDPRLLIVVALIWMIPATLVSSGYGISRSFSGSLRRLGIRRPTRRQVYAAVVYSVMIIPMFIGISYAQEYLWYQAGWPITDARALEVLFSDILTPAAAVLAALAAGVGEELAIRGLLQPRLGILLSNLFFTGLHAFQYHWDGLVSIFIFGTLMGLIRRRTNTVVCMIVHFLYDLWILGLFLLGRYLEAGSPAGV